MTMHAKKCSGESLMNRKEQTIWNEWRKYEFCYGVFAVLSIAAIAGCVVCAYRGGSGAHVITVAFLSALAGELLTYAFTATHAKPIKLLQDFIVGAVLTAAVRQPGMMCQAPTTWSELCVLTSLAGSLGLVAYFGVVVFSLATSGRRERLAVATGLATAPFLFNWLLIFQSPSLIHDLSRVMSPGLKEPAWLLQSLGRVAVLVCFNEVVAALVSIAVAHRLIADTRLHALVIGIALWCGFTPSIADGGSFATVASLSVVPRTALVLAATILSQAGLWGQVYLLTGVIMDGLRRKKPTWYWATAYLRSGCVKGAVYSGIFMGLVQAVSWLYDAPQALSFIRHQWLLFSFVAGALLFPLGKTIIESFDVSAPFFGRLRTAYGECTLYLRGAVIGTCFGALVKGGLLDAGALERFAWAGAVGAVAYGGIDLLRDACETMAKKKRLALQTWRAYALGACVGAVVAGLLAWYFDGRQLAVVADKLHHFAVVSYPASGLETKNYIIYPLFSKWCATDLGTVAGGVRLFYSDAVSGVVNWAFAAPLFSINLVLLTALFQRSMTPLRELFTRKGISALVEQTVRVLRWGLWMAPIINSFLKLSPDPRWYNQDGAVRTAVATWKCLSLEPQEFRAWSLQVFTNLLAYDWFRILIWLDHMGLRVATLVNLSFVGGDLADEKVARAVGYSARTRCVPEGVRRFATWAPLLIPFYIPRGAEWDLAWNGAAALRVTDVHTLVPPGARIIAVLLLGLLSLGLFFSIRVRRRYDSAIARVNTAEPGRVGVLPTERTYVLANGVYTMEFMEDGRGYSRVFSAVRKGEELDLTRQPAYPLQLCGKFLYVCDLDLADGVPERVWSLAYHPVRRVGDDYQVRALGRSSLRVTHTFGGIMSEAIVSVDEEDPLERWQVRLRNLEDRPRCLELTSYRELVMHTHGSFYRHPAFNHLHVGTWFVRPLNALLARNRLLKDPRRTAGTRRRSREVLFHAVRETPERMVTLAGYEDSRLYFIGSETLRSPEGLSRPYWKPEVEGLLYSFDPIASLRLRIEMPARSTTEVTFVDGYAEDEAQAALLICRSLGLAWPYGEAAEACSSRAGARRHSPSSLVPKSMRSPHADHVPSTTEEVFSFSEDGTEVRTGWQTPRPWYHIMANPGGYGVVAANDGNLYSFVGNAQQNGITPFNFAYLPAHTPGQVLYLLNEATGLVETPTYNPLRDKSATYSVTYGRGYVVFKKTAGMVDMELTIVVLPDQPAEVRLVRIRNRGSEALRYRVVPYFQIMLGEVPLDTRGKITVTFDEKLQTLCFTNRENDYWKGWGFLGASFAVEAYEWVRKRVVGGLDRDLCAPYVVEHGAPDERQRDDGYRSAALVGSVTVPAGGQETIALVLGQADDFRQVDALVTRYRQVSNAKQALSETKKWWKEKLSVLRVTTTVPGFDRMVNDWLPYQMYVSHLWGRTGPRQRSGAFGFRDQLQDVLPLTFLAPDYARGQILLHGAQQFPCGDVLAWWHNSWEGRSGVGMRSRASDPHLWLPYIVSHYVSATGDRDILDEELPFLEDKEIPRGADGLFFAQRPSRGRASLYEHCLRAIRHAIDRRGPHGLPLIGTGDWNDGLSLVGRQGKGESVWVGFFLYEILMRFAECASLQQDRVVSAELLREARRVQESLECAWRRDHYVRAFTDEGKELDVADALTASWPIISGAVEYERGLQAMEHGLRALEKEHMVLLCTPPFTDESDPYPGRIADYPPGVRENGGQYSHGSSWMVDALLVLADLAEKNGDGAQAAVHRAKAATIWRKISPLPHLTPEALGIYGLAPHQQPADIYFGPGYEGRGGWSWYTGAAARMLFSAYALLGLKMEGGHFVVSSHSFEPKGDLQLERVEYRGKEYLPLHNRE